MMAFVPIKDGEFTSTIYGMIRDNRFVDVMRILQFELQRIPNSRAGLSLLAYCFYQTQDFLMAAETYGKLAALYPQHSDYKLYHAQSLYHAFLFADAEAVMERVSGGVDSCADDPKISRQLLKLASAIKYREDDVHNARRLVEEYDAEDPDAEVNLACIDFKVGEYPKAMAGFRNATNAHGFRADLAYSLALCHWQLGEVDQTQRYIGEIVERGVKDHPELAVGALSEGVDVRSVGNSLLLSETALVEALNLRFAIAYKARDFERAAGCLTDMPPRAEEELDPVTLHNQALLHVDTQLADSFAKLQYLLTQNPFPPETFANLLLLYCRYEYYDLAADVLAENVHLTIKYLTQASSIYLFDYLDAMITLQTAPEEAFNKFDALAAEQLKKLRRAHARLQEAVDGEHKRAVEKAAVHVQECLQRYLPVLMGQAKILWERADYDQVEGLFRRSAELCAGDEGWRLNLAHTLFMQARRFYKESADCYAPIVNAKLDSMLDISAIVLASLCVCYILTNANEAAEEVMRRVEKEELQQPDRRSFHLCIINLVIGTLYCAKGNFEFGISRVIRALEPCERKLGIDTWFYAKRCMLSMFEQVAKQLLMVPDGVLMECLAFLETCESHGKEVTTITDSLLVQQHVNDPRRTVAFEARMLRAILLQILDY
ncbi:Tetratricopeptide repeat protein 30 [Aphelenchoides fujianensis]|nr:Tetratricopeptide repeat protein 30 [Aphelenchoides fujianensis]